MSNDTNPEPTSEPDAPNLGKASAIAAAVALAVFVLAILPAEFGIDPTGFGAAVGIHSMAAPSDDGPGVLTQYEAPFRSDSVNVTIPAHMGLEYKFFLEAGSDLLYSWNATGALYFDFHGEPAEDTTGYFQSYEEDTGSSADGSFRAPFAGSHGWYWRNDSGQPVTVTLATAGHYQVEGLR